jgi:hypothetical protein
MCGSRNTGVTATPLLLIVIVVATALNGLLAGYSVDGALVELPARGRIGAVAYATFARGDDLGNGIWVYPSTAISVALLTIAATIVAYLENVQVTLLASLSVATVLSIGHFLATARAAPIMLRVGKTPDDAVLLSPLLDRFARLNAVRATSQALTFFVVLWVLALAH